MKSNRAFLSAFAQSSSFRRSGPHDLKSSCDGQKAVDMMKAQEQQN